MTRPAVKTIRVTARLRGITMARKESHRSPRAHSTIESNNDILYGASWRFRVSGLCLKATHCFILGGSSWQRTPPIQQAGCRLVLTSDTGPLLSIAGKII
ncbi:hypothetical protein E2C01_008664 [Portunus trituberculatus]|uniref:Uncharacterized protein n=1 Tax=Portunus trituberculatus TaxID=210409 RepID=A0A5B7D2F3_PORTR|nr:hypothetical protein [Portunus trituberculatus]